MPKIQTLNIAGTPDEILAQLRRQFASIPDCPADLRAQMLPYQLAAVYGLATQYAQPDVTMLEIGTGYGASAFMLARAAPRAFITSLTVNALEANMAQNKLEALGCNVKVIVQPSWDFYSVVRHSWHLILVDGDHNHVRRDLDWWQRVAPGGLMLFHDFSPAGSPHASPVVYAELIKFGESLRRDPDVSIVDNTQTGMVGWYK